ncbi:PLP-dependent aminotransferase family protein [Pseudomonas sp. CMR5c]|uniref:MocR-like pyridoxine biosynthesis transcription factor PdxR n=1 Tax=Pseudomonas sp. CMR5c TaxID=658630 RepID=UPI00069CFC13|nr:PLP-dependent aminotransferase family protein [Pseudomonas sp. CMR5c]AZC18980.1 Transcriptional regulator, GntR family domain [Pseudomonas sp. CMR5c]
MSRGKYPVPLDLPLPQALGEGLGKQDSAYGALRQAILDKRLAAGCRLPSTRTLAQRWAMSRGTLEVVFDRLRSEGYVSRAAGSGTRVCAVVPDLYLSAPLAVAPAASDEDGPRPQPQGVRAGQPFVARLADPALFPLARWTRSLTRALAGAPAQSLCDHDPGGLPQLRQQIAQYLGQHRGIACEPAQVMVTTGIRHGLDLLARSLLRPGDEVCLEDPGYLSARELFALAGAQAIPVPVLEEGIDVDRLHEHGAARMVYVTPAHQAPLGMTMPVSRRLALLEWARRSGAWVVEDDYDSEFNYQSAPLAALKSLDRDDRVIYCGSFNKTLFAGLRVGFMLVPDALRERLLATLQSTGRSVGVIEQLALADYIASGAFLRYLRAARQAYQERRDLLLAILAREAPGCYSISGQQAGLHLLLHLPPGGDEARLRQRAAALGIVLQGLAEHCQQVRPGPAVIIGYAALSLAQIRFSGSRLAALLVDEARQARAGA